MAGPVYRHPSSPGTSLLPSSSKGEDGDSSRVVAGLSEMDCADDGDIVVVVLMVADVTVLVDVDVAVGKVVTGGRRGVTLQ